MSLVIVSPPRTLAMVLREISWQVSSADYSLEMRRQHIIADCLLYVGTCGFEPTKVIKVQYPYLMQCPLAVLVQ